MITADVILLATLAACLILGAGFGFGKVLRFITGGRRGKILSIIICYFLFGIVLNFGFVQDLLNEFTTALKDNGSWICNLLLSIRIDLIAFAVALFIVVQILRRIIVRIIAHVMEINCKPIRIINRVLGVVLLTAFVVILTLVAFQIIAWISGTDGAFYTNLEGSVFGVDKLFTDNPLNAIFENIRASAKSGT
nr:hypothetical protein [Clostridia bacterium]